MTAIIVDDEKHCRDVLALLLQRFCPQVQLLASCVDGTEGLSGG
jgi:two-component system LytT family response regulator